MAGSEAGSRTIPTRSSSPLPLDRQRQKGTSLRISVKDLVLKWARRGDLFAESGLIAQPVEGIRAHQRLQASRPDCYSKEVSLSCTIRGHGLKLRVHGRIDGVYTYPDRTLIEEIKTTYRDLNHFQRVEGDLHWAQTKIYAYIFCRNHELTQIEAQVVYLHLESNELMEQHRTFQFAELESFFSSTANRFLAWKRAHSEWIAARNKSLQKSAFPYPVFRKGQREMAVEVYRAIRDRQQLLLEAPTGIGKTIATLFPALKSLAEGWASRVVYLTARTTSQLATEDAVLNLSNGPTRIKVVTLTAREKICFNPGKACDGEECEFARGFYDRLGKAREAFWSHDLFNRETLESIAGRHQICPYVLGLELAEWADCVIGDFNYVFDPRVSLKRLTEPAGDPILIVDEAHNLVDRSREMYSAKLNRGELLAAKQTARNKRLEDVVDKLDTQLHPIEERCQREPKGFSESSLPQNLLPLLEQFLGYAEQSLLSGFHGGAPPEQLKKAYFSTAEFLRTAAAFDERYATCYEVRAGELEVKLFCIDPSSHLEKIHSTCRTVVFQSATLSPSEYFRKVLGCQREAKAASIPSPFPADNLSLLINDRIATTFRDRERTLPQLAEALVAFVEQKRGNYLIFLPSYQYLGALIEAVCTLCPSLHCEVQFPSMSEDGRRHFLSCFSSSNTKTLAGFAVMGGIFGEGIDLVGDRLTGAMVVGVGLPGLSTERELIRDYFENLSGQGFDYAYLYPGLNRVFQAAGRVIRSERDRGAVLLVDRRFSQSRYSRLLPRHWSPQRANQTKDLVRQLSRFWSPGGAPE